MVSGLTFVRIKRGGATVTAGLKVLPRRMGCDDWRGKS